MKGSYLMLIELTEPQLIPIGKLRTTEFDKGFYMYVGSALNGLEQRIQRHLRQTKKHHWHIDYLLQHAVIVDVSYRENTEREECMIAQKLNKMLPSIPDFGCSDCTCKSHLFHGSKETLLKTVNTLSMHRYHSDTGKHLNHRRL
jgi:Uri superfamily endonuclease